MSSGALISIFIAAVSLLLLLAFTYIAAAHGWLWFIPAIVSGLMSALFYRVYREERKYY